MTSRSAIAAGLGIDPALVTRYRARGMPMESVAAARAWKQANVGSRVRKELPSVAPQVRGKVDARVVHIERLARDAEHAIGAGTFDASSEEALRAAIRAVPKAMSDAYVLPVTVWDHLCRHLFEPGTTTPKPEHRAR